MFRDIAVGEYVLGVFLLTFPALIYGVFKGWRGFAMSLLLSWAGFLVGGFGAVWNFGLFIIGALLFVGALALPAIVLRSRPITAPNSHDLDRETRRSFSDWRKS